MRAVSICLILAAHVVAAAEADLGPIFSGTIRAKYPGPNITMKGVVVTLDAEKKAYVCYDTDLMRVSLAWTGEFLKFGNYMREISHPQPPEVAGTPAFGMRPGPGWTKDGNLADPRPKSQGPLPRDHAKHRGLYLHGPDVVFSYTVGNADVLEMPSVEYVEDQPIFKRTLQIDKDCSESMVICDLPETAPELRGGLLAVDLTNSQALAVAVSGAALEHKAGKALAKLSGKERSVVISIWRGPKAHLETIAKHIPSKTKAQDLTAFTRGGAPRFPEPVVTQAQIATNAAPYVVDTLTEPNSRTFFGGFDFLPDGRAAICAFHGDVWIVSGILENQLSWKRFATGLFQPLGLKVMDGKIYVTGRDQLTRLHDLNNDGEADFYANFNNDTAVTENYHEFCMDLHTDAEGNFYYAKGSPWPPEVKSPHQGCLFKVSRDGSKLEVYATGFRAPNGLGLGPKGELTTSDNEGHYMPASKLNWVKRGGFYGMVPAAHRTPKPDSFDQPICWLPKNMDNSGGGQVWVTSDQWGPLKNHLLFMSYGRGTLLHVMQEEVEGQIQAAVAQFPFRFGTGVMRGRFNPRDGQLYLCGLRGWQTDGPRNGGFYRVRHTGAPARIATEVHAVRNGMKIRFTSPLEETSATNLENYSIEQWNYKWTPEYGSPEFSVKDPSQKKHDPVPVKSVQLLADKRTVFLEIPEIQPVNQMKIKVRINAADGAPISQDIYNTIHRLGNGQNLSLAR